MWHKQYKLTQYSDYHFSLLNFLIPSSTKKSIYCILLHIINEILHCVYIFNEVIQILSVSLICITQYKILGNDFISKS